MMVIITTDSDTPKKASGSHHKSIKSIQQQPEKRHNAPPVYAVRITQDGSGTISKLTRRNAQGIAMRLFSTPLACPAPFPVFTCPSIRSIIRAREKQGLWTRGMKGEMLSSWKHDSSETRKSDEALVK